MSVGAESEEREKNQQDATIRCLLSTSVSTCFGHHYARLQENKDRVTAFGILLWFCWMWLVAVHRYQPHPAEVSFPARQGADGNSRHSGKH
jgi:hypothetical protein